MNNFTYIQRGKIWNVMFPTNIIDGMSAQVKRGASQIMSSRSRYQYLIGKKRAKQGDLKMHFKSRGGSKKSIS